MPSASGYTVSRSGTHRGCVIGPAGTNFDLALYKRSWWGSWSLVARSAGSTSTENIAYNGTSGTYYWRISSSAGSGSFVAGMTRP
jgi:hypothetical protein